MVDLSSKYFNALALTRDGAVLSGQVSLAVMSRLCQALDQAAQAEEEPAPGGGEYAAPPSTKGEGSGVESNLARAQAKVRGAIDEQGQAYLQVAVEVVVSLVCQRCLQPMQQRLTVQSRLAVVQGDDQAAMLPGDYEPLVVADPERVALAPIIEDELLLALPPYPHHDRGSCTEQAVPSWQGPPAATDDRPHPFAELAKLRDALKQQKE